MKVLRYLLPLVLLVARLSATITPTADVYGPQQPASLTATFTTGLAFQQSSDLIIVDAGQTNAPRYPATVLVLGSDYTVSGGGYNSANQMQLGTFTLTNTGGGSILLGDNIYVLRNVPANQLTVFANGGYLTAAMIEQALDKQATLSQMAFNTGNASLRVEAYETTNSVPPQLIMTKNARAGKLLGFDANGNVSFTTSSGGGGATGIQSVSGTTNQVIAVTTNNAVTLSTPQNIDTGAAVQFGSLGIGIAPSVSIPINFQPSVTDNGGTGKAVRISPTIFQNQTGDVIYNTVLGGTINSNSYTNGVIYELTLGSPTVSGSYNIGYQLYLAGLNSGTFTTKYGIFQNGTETNQLNNLKLTPSGGGAITFADGTVQSTAASGSGGTGTVTNFTAGNLSPLFTTAVATGNSTPALSFSLSNAAGYSIFGNNGSSSGGPAYNTLTSYLDSLGNTQGALLYRGPAQWVALPAGTTGQVLTVGAGSSLTWANTGSGGGVTNIAGTTNQITANASTGSVVLSTPQNIDTAASVQFGTLGIGTTVGAGNGVNLQPSVTASAGQSKGLRISPSITGAANGDSLYDTIIGGTISTSFTTSNLYELTLGAPTVTGSYSNGYQLYLSGLTTGTYSNKYGIYQAGTEANVFSGSVTVPAFTATGTTTLATSLTGYLYGTSGVVSAVTTIPTSALSGTVSLTTQVSGTLPVANGGTGVTTSTGTGSTVLSASPTFTGTLTAANLTATGTTTLATSLSGYLSASSGVVSASSTIPTTALSGTITNAQLANSSITIAGTSTALGGSISQDTITGLSTTGLVKRTAANTLAIASSGTDYAPATSGTSLLYGNGSGGFSNATVGSSLTFSSGALNTVQGITTTSNPQFGSLGIGAAASGTAGDLYANTSLEVGVGYASNIGVNFQPSITASTQSAKGLRISPTITAASNTDVLYTSILGGTVTNSSFTGVTYSELTLGSPTASGTYSVGSQLQLSGLNSGTFTTKYGIYQTGTEVNSFAGAFQMTTSAKQATNQNLTPATTTVTSGASPSINWTLGNSFDLTLTSATAATISFTGAVDGQVITIAIHQPASGTPTTVSWSGVSTIKWSGGTAPTQTATLSKTDVYTIYYNATAGVYYGSYVQNF